ncbi:MAG: DUF2269 family protein [Hyphomicrobium sp.]
MRKALKFLHTLAACGLIGALVGYAVILLKAPQETASQYADARVTIDALCDYVLLPSLAVALVSGMLSMAVHRPFQEHTWVWIKALLGIGMFEATLAIIQSKADYAARLSAKIAAGQESPDALTSALATEWSSLAAIMAISVANIVLGIWRPPFKQRPV